MLLLDVPTMCVFALHVHISCHRQCSLSASGFECAELLGKLKLWGGSEA